MLLTAVQGFSRQVEHLDGEMQSVVFFIPLFFQKKTFRVEQS